MTVKKTKLKRVNILIPESMYEQIVKERGWQLSGTVREALEDILSSYKVTISVSEETRDLYQSIFNETHFSDTDFEPFFREALGKFLESAIDRKVQNLKELQGRLEADPPVL